jgi:hypothetical protein
MAKEERVCLECGIRFAPLRDVDARYCSPKCRWRAWDHRNPRVKTPVGISNPYESGGK